MERAAPYFLTFGDCAGATDNREAARAFVRRVTGAAAVFEVDASTKLWTARLPAGWVFVASNTSRGWRELGWWSDEFFVISVEDGFVPAPDCHVGYASTHPETLPDDWTAPSNLWATVHRYALIPRERVDLVPALLTAENMQNGYPALALPCESELEYEQRTGALLHD